jgi:hypothetical protein
MQAGEQHKHGRCIVSNSKKKNIIKEPVNNMRGVPSKTVLECESSGNSQGVEILGNCSKVK